MKFLEFLFGDSSEKTIGTFETAKADLKARLLSLTGYVGMQNPVKIVSTSKKGVSIQKIGKDSYKITLLAFTPPIDIEWTGTILEDEFMDKVEAIIERNQKIAYINVRHAGTNGISYQFAVI